VKAAALPRLSGRRVRAAGWLITGKTVRTRHGDPMEFLTFEDETGIFETTFFPEAYRRWSPLVDRGRPYLLEGKVEQDWGATTLTVERLSPIRRMSASACRSSFAGSYAPPHFGQ
jgi:DNA polymerase-3 subunit alpha/error-prone DNA polymerase